LLAEHESIIAVVGLGQPTTFTAVPCGLVNRRLPNTWTLPLEGYSPGGWNSAQDRQGPDAWPELVRLYRLTLDAPARNTQPRYNICPTTNIDAVIVREGERELLPMRWGLVPSWWPKPLKEMRVATFNARAEDVARKPTFRDAFKRTRCLIPASGYYEWQDTADGKQPYYFTRKRQTSTFFEVGGGRFFWKSKPKKRTHSRGAGWRSASPGSYGPGNLMNTEDLPK
jgi:SOS response associated peptidase (SRAP)